MTFVDHPGWASFDAAAGTFTGANTTLEPQHPRRDLVDHQVVLDVVVVAETVEVDGGSRSVVEQQP